MIKHTPEALDIWLTKLHPKVKGKIAIAVKLAGANKGVKHRGPLTAAV
ncbi:transposase [Pectobacterium atrosepticum ICMP 1526]|nr:transposase [Pectobacterium atrosepticum ICMP 1526]